MQIAKRVPFDNPDVLNGVRAMYIVSNLIILFIYYIIHSRINKKKGMFLHPRRLVTLPKRYKLPPHFAGHEANVRVQKQT